MAETLRELFDEMMSDEPPLRTTSESAAAAGRRLQVRRRALWTATGAALTVVLATAVPTLALSGGSGARTAVLGSASASGTPSVVPSGGPSGTARPTVSAAPDPRVQQFQHCPGTTRYPNFDYADGSVLPNVDRAAAAVQAAGPGIAPGRQFILRVHSYFTSTQKLAGHPQNALIFDVGDDDGFGFVSFQMLVQKGPTPQQWAQYEMDAQNECHEVMRRDYPDGSVAIHIVPTNADEVAASTQVYYYSVKGYMLNMGAYIEGWSASDDPATPPPPPPLPVRQRGHLPLTVAQLMELADVIAHS